ncbi:DNA-binding CsgD family transcriptional regulator [Natronobacillus azotifigens]|uniref:DUF2087 domain-containing protein n=1 Tax=Natronobacillus azotifigens TaxID=472978 RepID=A0A9J6RE83_9BACI|nr:DUF2087 domain-containing protein [Natronobacillus azotifigens]MCZ0703871.1 DUF2087 domain-containing protein [Natronobacillus azotifigens]
MKSEFSLELSDYKKGYYVEGEKFTCLYCETVFEQGVIYPADQHYQTAERAIKQHIVSEHGGQIQPLLQLDKRSTGLSDHQMQLLRLFAEGLSDKDIAKRLELSVSTIRNHRFKFREKERQAKIFLAMMELMDTPNDFIPVHKGARMVDDRYAITQEEKDKVIKTYFNEAGRVDQFPSKEKRKIIILQEVIKKFDHSRNYQEQEVNAILQSIFDDHVTVRRYLIEYGFMDRSKDGQSYWVKG